MLADTVMTSIAYDFGETTANEPAADERRAESDAILIVLSLRQLKLDGRSEPEVRAGGRSRKSMDTATGGNIEAHSGIMSRIEDRAGGRRWHRGFPPQRGSTRITRAEEGIMTNLESNREATVVSRCSSLFLQVQGLPLDSPSFISNLDLNTRRLDTIARSHASRQVNIEKTPAKQQSNKAAT